MIRQLAKDERGHVAPLFAVWLLGLVVMVGLVTDGGLLFAARRNLQGVADGASRSGAMAIDVQGLRDSAGRSVQLEVDEAREAAETYLTSVGFRGTVSISVGSEEVTVHLEEEQSTLVMGLAGMREIKVRATSSARPRSGIEYGG